MSPDFCLACGNYSEDRDEEAFIIGTNPIIYCSLCHIGVHLKCVGLEAVPEDFVCDKCKFLKRGSLFLLFILTRRRRPQRSLLPLLPQRLRVPLPVRPGRAQRSGHCREAGLRAPALLPLPRGLLDSLVLPAGAAGAAGPRGLQGHLPGALRLSGALRGAVRPLRAAGEAAAAQPRHALRLHRGEKDDNRRRAAERRDSRAEHRRHADLQQHQDGVRAGGSRALAALRRLLLRAALRTRRRAQRRASPQRAPRRPFFSPLLFAHSQTSRPTDAPPPPFSPR